MHSDREEGEGGIGRQTRPDESCSRTFHPGRCCRSSAWLGLAWPRRMHTWLGCLPWSIDDDRYRQGARPILENGR
ncbi:hypothetical protein Mapa_001972 [Marchantia paleacea]|nr:hypothetical protein Mapa_001972 [Marchantia paleacea]